MSWRRKRDIILLDIWLPTNVREGENCAHTMANFGGAVKAPPADAVWYVDLLNVNREQYSCGGGFVAYDDDRDRLTNEYVRYIICFQRIGVHTGASFSV